MSVVGSNILAGASGAAAAAGIERSLRFNGDDSAFLTKTYTSAGSRTTWTWSGWAKIDSSDRKILFSATGGTGQFFTIDFFQEQLWVYNYTSPTYESRLSTNQLFRDSSAWFHLVFVFDTTNATADDRHRLYINGEQVTSFSARTNPTQNYQGYVNSTGAHYISGYTATGTLPWNGYIADVHFIDGQALAATDFGEYDDNNVWQPKAYGGTYGTNGYHLDFSDNSSTSALGTDSSGNSNTWTVNNLSVASGAGNDSLIDTPINYTASSGNNGGNYCTWSSLDKDADVTLANGNLDMTQSDAGGVKGTIGVTSGKWYWEITKGSTVNQSMGVATSDAIPTTFSGGYAGSCGWGGAGYLFAQSPFSRASTDGTGFDTATTGDVLGFALDLDSATKTLKFYKNGTLVTTDHIVIADSDLHIHPVIGASVADSGANAANFGQRPFEYTPPTGHLSLCTANLPDPTIEEGSTAMDVKLYTGNGSTQAISGLGFSPDLVWIKNRAQADNNKLLDTVRGATEELESNTTDAELTNTDGLTAFNSDGFDLGADVEYNTNTESYVAWTWDAGTSTVSNTDGSITSNVRANASVGFSVLTAPIDSSGGTIGHGLNASPGLIIGKNRDATGNWNVWHSSLSTTQYLLLNSTGVVATSSTIFNGVSTTTFTVGSGWSSSSASHVFYCWAPVEGYSAFGSYTGGAGTFVYTGFRPRFILAKVASVASSWVIWDTARNPYNPVDLYLQPNGSAAEASVGSTGRYNIFSNGFEVLAGSTSETIYAAFAEHPFSLNGGLAR